MVIRPKRETVRIRRFKVVDAGAVARVVRHAERITLSPFYPKKLIEYFCTYNSKKKILEHHHTAKMWVAREVSAGRIVGIISLRNASIRKFYVDPRYQGRGIGKSLFEACKASAKKQGLQMLEVKSSLYAEPVYKALGFKKIKKAKSKEVGVVYFNILMKLDLKNYEKK